MHATPPPIAGGPAPWPAAANPQAAGVKESAHWITLFGPFIPCSYALPKRARYPPLGQGLLLHPARQTCRRHPLVPTHAVCPACVFSRLRRTQLAGCEHPCYQLIPIWYVTALSFVPPPLRSFPLFKLRGPILPHTHTHHAHHTNRRIPPCMPHTPCHPLLSPAFPCLVESSFRMPLPVLAKTSFGPVPQLPSLPLDTLLPFFHYPARVAPLPNFILRPPSASAATNAATSLSGPLPPPPPLVRPRASPPRS